MENEKCLVELDEVLNNLAEEDLKKIPYEIREAIKEKKDKSYNWKYDKTKKLEEQNLNRKTIAMLSYLNMEYLLNEKQRIFMDELHKVNENQLEIEKSKKYNTDDIFKKQLTHKNRKNEVALIDVKEEKWYKKIFSFFKNIFKKDTVK